MRQIFDRMLIFAKGRNCYFASADNADSRTLGWACYDRNGAELKNWSVSVYDAPSFDLSSPMDKFIGSPKGRSYIADLLSKGISPYSIKEAPEFLIDL